MMAEMVGLNGDIARRCGLLHDIGKAADHELEGGHPKIGADLLIYQELDALKSAVRAANPRLAEFEASCFDGHYVTGDVTPEYLAQLAGTRHEERGEPGRDDDRGGPSA